MDNPLNSMMTAARKVNVVVTKLCLVVRKEKNGEGFGLQLGSLFHGWWFPPIPSLVEMKCNFFLVMAGPKPRKRRKTGIKLAIAKPKSFFVLLNNPCFLTSFHRYWTSPRHWSFTFVIHSCRWYILSLSTRSLQIPLKFCRSAPYTKRFN